MSQTSNRPLWSDWYAMNVPSGEKKGLTFMPEFDVKRLNTPLATSTSQTFGLPEREEKKTIFFRSGDQFGWKSPPRPVVSWRAFESPVENCQIFMSPARSELKATILPSGDHAPRLSSRVVLTTASGDPLGSPVCGTTGSFQMSAFWRSVAKARRLPSGEVATSTSCPAPVVTCCSGPLIVPSPLTGARQIFMPPLRYEEK